MPFLKLIRFPNLFIVGLTQYILFYRIIRSALEVEGISPIFDHFHFAILVFVTICITAGSYMINDINDYAVDLINKPNKVYINERITLQVAYWATGVIYLLGFLMAFYLAMYTGRLPYLLLYPGAILGLLLYNLRLKARPLVGNLIVALFCGGVTGILWLAEEPNLNLLQLQNKQLYHKAWAVVSWFVVFAFLSNLIREMIKDLQDMEGDKAGGLKTMPVAWGIKNSKYFCLLFLGALFFFIAYYGYNFQTNYQQVPLLIINIILLISIGVTVLLLVKARNKSNYHLISQLLKGIMVLGLFLLLFFKL